MLPITGPYTSLSYLNGPPNSFGYKPRHFEEFRSWWRQKPPYDLPLNFTHYCKRVFKQETHNTAIAGPYAWYTDVNSIPVNPAADSALYARAYEEFRERIGAEVQAGLMLAESKQAMNTIENRLSQLARAALAVRRGNLSAAAGILRQSVSSRRGVRGRSKDFGATWLEYWLGWAPLAADIYSAAEVLCLPIQPKMIKVRRSKTWRDTSLSSSFDNGVDKGYRSYEAVYDQMITLRGEVDVLNPNLGLLEQCGLVNPLTIAWELVPFSFVVDWFVNVGDFLEGWTDYSGISLINPSRTIFTRWRESDISDTTYNYTRSAWPGPPTNPALYRYSAGTSSLRSSVSTSRIVGPFPGPDLHIRDPWVLSATRALTASSLLLIQLKG